MEQDEPARSREGGYFLQLVLPPQLKHWKMPIQERSLRGFGSSRWKQSEAGGGECLPWGERLSGQVFPCSKKLTFFVLVNKTKLHPGCLAPLSISLTGTSVQDPNISTSCLTHQKAGTAPKPGVTKELLPGGFIKLFLLGKHGLPGLCSGR